MREIQDASAQESILNQPQDNVSDADNTGDKQETRFPILQYDHSPRKCEASGISSTTDTHGTPEPAETSDLRSFNLSFVGSETAYDSDRDGNIGDDSSGDEDCIQAQDTTMNLRSQLAQWKLRFGVTDVAMNALLAILKPLHPRLPKDTRTVLPPPKNAVMKNISGGTYHHFGFLSAICCALRDYDLSNMNALRIQLGIDGLPVHRSNNMHLWPILGRVQNVHPHFARVFVIGIFYGDSKPTWCHEFLEDFCDEYNALKGRMVTVNGAQVRIELSSIICDAQARAFVKCTRAFNHKHGCDKCEEEASWDGRTVFLGQNAPKRTDVSFNNRRDADHHIEIRNVPLDSPLKLAGVGEYDVYCPVG